MAIDPCEPCNCSEVWARSVDSYRQAVLKILCQILAATGGGAAGGADRFDWEVLCDPETGAAVLLRFEYETDGTVTGVTGWTPDGTAYVGDLNLLTACETTSGIYAEDSAFTDGDLGFFALSVRQDTAVASTDASGDYSFNAVNRFGAALVDLQAPFRDSADVDTSPIKTRSQALGATTAGFLGLARANEASPPNALVAADALAVPLSATRKGALYVELNNLTNSDSNRSILKTPGAGEFLTAQSPGVIGITVQQNIPTSAAGIGFDFRPIKSNDFCSLFVDPADREANFLSGTLAFGAVASATFATIVTNAGAAKGRALVVLNRLDRDVALSLDGTNDDWFVPQGGDITIDLAMNGRWASTDLEVRALVSDPTAGSIFASIMI